MSTPEAGSAVRSTIVVEASPEVAFEVFTAGMASWWPADHHVLRGELAEMVFEPRVGGDIYDRATDGSECRWSRVLVYEPPQRVVISWDITTSWQIETDPARASEVEVRFTAQGEGRTLVELEHRGLERHGDGWEGMRDAVGSPGGWQRGLQAFAGRLQTGLAG